MKRTHPTITLCAKPEKLKLATPASALARWDPQLAAAREAPDDQAEIAILGEIGPEMWGGIDSLAVKRALKQIGDAPVRLVINSPGGDAFEGVAIYNLLRQHKGEVTAHVLGLAASAASVIAMAGDRIEMAEASFMMIHSSWGLAIGSGDEIRAFAETLDKLDESVASLYARRTGRKYAEVMDMMKAETYMTAPDAVSNGFADVALEEKAKKKEARAAAGPSIFLARTPVPPELLAASGQVQRFAVRMALRPRQDPPASRDLVVTLKPPTKGTEMKLREQIGQFEAKRAASVAQMDAIMQASADSGSTLDAETRAKYDGLDAEVKAIDEHLVRLKAHEARQLASATALPAAQPGSPAPAADPAAAPGNRLITVRPNIEKGIAFTRYVKAMALAKGDPMRGAAIAKANQKWRDQTPEVEQILLAAVAAGDTTTAGWASDIAYAQNLVSEFIEFLRPQTIVGRIPKLTRVPFNVRVGGQSSGSSAFWVGQGKPVPVSKLGTTNVSLGIAKAAGIVVIDEELVRNSQPSAELLVRNDLGKAIAQFQDVQFVDPAVAAVANVSPASITNLVNPTAASGTAASNFRTDMQTLVNSLISQNFDPSGAVIIMTPTQALSISMMLTANGVPLYPTLTMEGGTLLGIPVITSMSAQLTASPSAGEGGMIILFIAPEVMLADDGDVAIDASREAALEMLDNPTNSSTGSTVATSMVSMFQTNSVAIKAVRFMNWQKRRAGIVSYIKDAAYVA